MTFYGLTRKGVQPRKRDFFIGFQVIAGLLVRTKSDYAKAIRNTSNGETNTNAKPKTAYFGFQLMDENEKAEAVYGVFHNVSSSYDKMNDAMSLGIHRIWKDQFVETLAPTPGLKLLDVAGGTGDVAFRVLHYLKTLNWSTEHFQDLNKRSPNGTFPSASEPTSISDHPEADDARVVVCDINQSMMEYGKQRAKQLSCNRGLSWLCGDAEQLPIADNSFDAYTIAFGIRNCIHLEKVLSEAYRVLRPGGRFMCLEFSHVKNPLIRQIYDAYSFQVIPVIGELVAGDWKSYQYLVESIRKFPDQETFASMIQSCGFSMVDYKNLSLGIVAIHSGFKL